MEKSKHGANLFELSKKMNLELEDFKDFSSNINPFGASKKALNVLSENLGKVSIYPDPNYKDLKKSISIYSGCKEENVLVGSGASTFISGFIKVLECSKSLIITPAYSEYEKELTIAGSQIYKYTLKYQDDFVVNIDDLISVIVENQINTIILCNPNNPTGSIISKEDIKKILETTKTNVIVDETYIEFTDVEKYSATKLCNNYDNIYVIRGTSKFFATPGIRLGYAIISNKSVKEAFDNQFATIWDINIFADIIGKEMFLDKEYQKQTFEKIQEQKDYIFKNIQQIQALKVYKSYGNFILVKIVDEKLDAKNLYEYMLNKKMIIRDCSNFRSLDKSFFRVCILKDEDNMQLVKYLNEFFA